MPRPAPRLATLTALLTLAATLGGCWPDSGPDYHGETADPPDLTVRQSPGSTVHVGDTVTFTAVFKDSLNPKWLYDWILNVDGEVPIVGHERSIRWAPQVAGNYRGRIWVYNSSANSRSTLSFRTTILP